ncbi:MAG: hypothetical protein PVI86_02895 [Phycisphaerae bacterium]|jgi:hypothetical protein
MRKFFVQPLHDMLECLNRFAESGRPQLAMGLTVGAMLVSWFIYVPIHELLHVFGCVAPGGSVSELEVAPQYGGHLLAKWFDFVVCGGEYAGRLTAFDTKNSDWIYLATVFAPFVLSVIIGVPILKLCARRSRPLLAGVGVVIGLAPFYNIIGDYYEIGSVTTTGVLSVLLGNEGVAFEGIRGDDIFKLVGTLFTSPADLGLEGAGAWFAGFVLVLVSFVLGILAAFVTYYLGHLFARLLIKLPPGEATGKPSAVAPDTAA